MATFQEKYEEAQRQLALVTAELNKWASHRCGDLEEFKTRVVEVVDSYQSSDADDILFDLDLKRLSRKFKFTLTGRMPFELELRERLNPSVVRNLNGWLEWQFGDIAFDVVEHVNKNMFDSDIKSVASRMPIGHSFRYLEYEVDEGRVVVRFVLELAVEGTGEVVEQGPRPSDLAWYLNRSLDDTRPFLRLEMTEIAAVRLGETSWSVEAADWA